MTKLDKNASIEKISHNFISATLSKSVKESRFIKVKINIKPNFTYYIEEYTQTQSFQKTVSKTELLDYLKNNIGTNFKNAIIKTDDATVNFFTNKKGFTRVLWQNVTFDKKINAETFVQNRQKKYILQEGEPVPFLVELGLMTKEGKIYAKQYDKFRQINRFLEFIDDILPKLMQNAFHSKLQIIDFGCGKSYLTFALYHFLTKLRKIDCQIIGIDLKQDVIEFCKNLAKSCAYDGLHFFCDDIRNFGAKQIDDLEVQNVMPDLVITLHACDVATDFALEFAVKNNAKVILSVPCCQHELNNYLSKKENAKNTNETVKPFLKHGIIRDKFLSLATDCLRGELLERMGYKVQMLEFIDMEHTSKNVLIRAVKR